MIVGLSKLLATKIREIDLPALPPHPNPVADWSGHLFTVHRAQYILITNGATLYSAVIFRKGIVTYDAYLKKMMNAIREVMVSDGLLPAPRIWSARRPARYPSRRQSTGRLPGQRCERNI
jgi:hypothetical protein